jgi:hypothetical protein
MVAAERDFYRTALETAARRGQVRPEPDPPAALSLDALDRWPLAHLMSLAGWGVSMLLPKAGLYGVNFLLVVYTDPETPQLTANCDRAGAITSCPTCRRIRGRGKRIPSTREACWEGLSGSFEIRTAGSAPGRIPGRSSRNRRPVPENAA